MKLRTNVKAGKNNEGLASGNHNETLVQAKGLQVKTSVKAGAYCHPVLGCPMNHNETLISEQAKAKGLQVKTSVKAGLKDVIVTSYS